MIALKVLHLLALVVALGSGIARLVLAGAALRDPESRPVLAPLLRRLGDLGNLGLIVLILSGVALYLATYAGATLGGAFHLKMLGATTVVALAGYGYLRARSVPPLPLPAAIRVGQATVATAIATTALAVLAFSD